MSLSTPRTNLARYALTIGKLRDGRKTILDIEPERTPDDDTFGRAISGDMGLLTTVTVSAKPTGGIWTREGALDNVWAEVTWSGSGDGNQTIVFDALRGGTVTVPGNVVNVTAAIKGGGSYDYSVTANHATAMVCSTLTQTYAVQLNSDETSFTGDVPTFARGVTARVIGAGDVGSLSLYSHDILTFTAAAPFGGDGSELYFPHLSGLDRKWTAAYSSHVVGPFPVVILVSFLLNL